MRIYIPTKGRISNQLTIQNLPDGLRGLTTIVAPESEMKWHTANWRSCAFLAQPDPKMGIAEKRKWIVEQTTEEKLVMLDDDLRFAVRRIDDPGKFRAANELDILMAFNELQNILDEDIPHAGFAARGGSIGDAARRGGWQQAKRQMYVLGYHAPTVKANAVFGRLGTHEDMDVTLQLLTKGFPNMINFSFVVDQKFGNPGGCTSERTVDGNNLDCYKLAEFFPQFVRLSEKEYSGSTPRVEVICAWQKALEYGLQQRK